MKFERPKKVTKEAAKASKAVPSAKNASATRTRRPATKSAPKLPPILLEGDETPTPPLSGPGERYALGSTLTETGRALEAAAELPEAYGTKRLLLTARDPHWLYAHWDLTKAQLKRYNALSADGHLVLRIYRNAIEGKPFTEIHVHPESRNWFAHVGVGGAKFLAELGYYLRTGKWVRVSASKPTVTPPDTMSEDFSVAFETLPADLQFKQLIKLVKSAVSTSAPLIEAIQQFRAAGHAGLPEAKEIHSQRWTPEQEQALAQLVTMDAVRRVWIGSLEITELIRRQLFQAISSAAVAEFSQPAIWSGAVSSISSPFGGAEVPKGFWFNVNAELIIYGATEPDAQVTIGGRPIKLRADGTFSYRFALPDGNYELPAVATSADGTDQRAAALAFQRSTEYSGEVRQHPQDPQLKPPQADHLT